MEGILVPISLFGMIAAVVIAPLYFRSRDRQRMIETLRTAFERGQPVPPEVIEALGAGDARPKRRSAENDLRSGVVLVAVAAAMIILGLVIGQIDDPEAAWIMAGVASFPGFLGLSFIGFWFAKRGSTDRFDV